MSSKGKLGGKKGCGGKAARVQKTWQSATRKPISEIFLTQNSARHFTMHIADSEIPMRTLTPELLDHLPHDDPGAQRSRRDLRRINFFMGNERWLISKLPRAIHSVSEIGAGDGHLLSRIAKKHPSLALKAYDLAPRPVFFPSSLEWIQGDIFSQLGSKNGGLLIANLFLHHFTDQQLAELGSWMKPFDYLLICEPWRALLPRLMAKFASPLIHTITRHDMRVSIEAGFVPGEMAKLLRLSDLGFDVKETLDWRGALRLVAVKQGNLPHSASFVSC